MNGMPIGEQWVTHDLRLSVLSGYTEPDIEDQFDRFMAESMKKGYKIIDIQYNSMYVPYPDDDDDYSDFRSLTYVIYIRYLRQRSFEQIKKTQEVTQ